MVGFLRRNKWFERIKSFQILISVGRENPSGMSVAPSQEEEKILESRNQEEIPSEPEAREASSPSTARKKRLFSLLLVGLSTLLFLCLPQEEPHIIFIIQVTLYHVNLLFSCYLAFSCFGFILQRLCIFLNVSFFLLNSVFTQEHWIESGVKWWHDTGLLPTKYFMNIFYE